MIGIIAAMSVELEKLKACTEVTAEREMSGLTFIEGTLEGKRVVMTVCGEGKVNAALCAEAMCLIFHTSLIINTGVAGALSPTLHVPDIAVATATCEHDYDLTPLGYQRGEVLFPGGSAIFFKTDEAFTKAVLTAAGEQGIHAEAGVIVSGDSFIADKDKKAELADRFGGIACEMEGGSIGHVAHVNGVSYAVIRAISDSADDAAAYDPVRAAENSVKLTRRALALYRPA